MVDVFEEVEEELRAEKWRRLARKYGPWLAGGVAAGLLVAGGFWGWHSWRENQAAQASVAYDRGLEAMRRGDQAAAATAFEEAGGIGVGAYRAMALMAQAEPHAQAGRVNEAVALLEQAASATRDPILSDQARLKAALLLLDTTPLPAMEERLTPLTAEGRPYRLIAREALAMARMAGGQTDAARADFMFLASALDTPEGVRQRSQAALAVIEAGLAGQVKAVVAQAAAQPPRVEGPANPFAPAGGQ